MPDREAVPPFHGGGEHFAPQGGLDHILDVADIDAIAGRRLAVDVDVEVIAAGDPLGHHVGRAR